MNRDKDFHKKNTGTLINKNTKDYRRAKNRNRVMNTAVAALGEGGELSIVSEKVKEMNDAPSRAEERVTVLEAKLAETNAVNKELDTKMNQIIDESEDIKQQLIDTISENEEIKNNLSVAYEIKNDIIKLKQLVETLESK